MSETDQAAARVGALEVASWIWTHREQFLRVEPGPAEAVRRALSAPVGPVVVNECSDNTGGGAPGDGTHLLRAMIEAAPPPGAACFAFIVDPVAVQQAIAAGVGATVHLRLGGRHGDLHGEPIVTEARVRVITDGCYTLSAWAPGMRMDHGPMCRLDIAGIDVVVGSRRSQTFDHEVFLLHGIDVTRYQLIGLKSSHHFRAGFASIAADIVTADSPGLTTNRIDVFDHRQAREPLWPLDVEATWAGSVSGR